MCAISGASPIAQTHMANPAPAPAAPASSAPASSQGLQQDTVSISAQGMKAAQDGDHDGH